MIMKTATTIRSRRTSSFWVPLFLLAMAAVAEPSTDDEMKNATSTQGNGTSWALSHIPQGNDNIEVGTKTANTAVVNNSKSTYNGGGGGYGWGWGGGGGGGGGGWEGGGGGGGGWGWGGGGGGGGGGGYSWGCNGNIKRGKVIKNNNVHRRRVCKTEYKIGEFAECMNRGRCRGMRLDCPLHCGGPCFYDCYYMCKAHCQRP